jgi:flagellar biogenesis protein FliO
MSDKEKTEAEKELAKKNLRLVLALALVAFGFYVGIFLMYW